MASAVSGRASDNQAYVMNVEELTDAIAALNECIDLVTELQNEASFV